MNVSLTPKLEKWVSTKVASGQYTSASEVVREALRTLAERETLRERLNRDIAVGMAEIQRGETIPGSKVFAAIRSRSKSRKAT